MTTRHASKTKALPVSQGLEHAYEVALEAAPCLREAFLSVGLFLTDDFKEEVLLEVSQELPKVKGKLNVYDFTKEIGLLEAFEKTPQKLMKPDGFAVIFLALFLGGPKGRPSALLCAKEINLFYVNTRKGPRVVWVDMAYKGDSFSGCGVFTFDMDNEVKYHDCRIFM